MKVHRDDVKQESRRRKEDDLGREKEGKKESQEAVTAGSSSFPHTLTGTHGMYASLAFPQLRARSQRRLRVLADCRLQMENKWMDGSSEFKIRGRGRVVETLER